jgi:hypothetical protein
MPLSLTTEEMDLPLALAQPIHQRHRDQFLQEVAQGLCHGNGSASRFAG